MVATVPRFLRWFYPNRVWAGQGQGKAIYLTFDDGPIPEVTPWVLKQLKKYNAKATFFCIGQNVQNYPEVFEQILTEGHTVANHTFNHLNGWKTPEEEYLLNTTRAQQVIEDHLPVNGPPKNHLFRPPYGKMSRKQEKQLQQKGFKAVMWSILSMDYDNRIASEKVVKNVIQNAKPGSIVVFHDSLKAQKNLTESLPQVLEYLEQQDYVFRSLS